MQAQIQKANGNTYATIMSNNNSKISHFLPSLSAEADRRVVVKITQELQGEFKMCLQE